MDKVIEALKRQAKREQERIDKGDPKADEEYLYQLEKAIDVINLYIAIAKVID